MIRTGYLRKAGHGKRSSRPGTRKVRFIGFTGHKSPDIHTRMLTTAASRNFRFDAVQMPLNVMDHHFASFEKTVLPTLVQDSIGVLGMKPMGDHLILESGTVSPIKCFHYALNLR
ncbi:MAG: hypothetical protein LUQ13_05270 [Methanomicrobiales archaeon]|nr:hypothetical protein [Methanomicrobiales archaeon]